MGRTSRWHESELIQRATVADQRYCEAKGFIPQAACTGLSDVRGRTVILRNANGELARYKVRADGRLHRVGPRPE